MICKLGDPMSLRHPVTSKLLRDSRVIVTVYGELSSVRSFDSVALQ